jgi:hypothetical protein
MLAGLSHTVEFDVLGRIQPQVEQTCAQFSVTTRLRFSHHFVQVLALRRHVRHLPPLCCRTRTRHGCGYQKDPVRLTLTLFPPFTVRYVDNDNATWPRVGCTSLLCSLFRFR